MHGNLEAVNGGASLAAGVGSAFQSPLEIFLEEAGSREERGFFGWFSAGGKKKAGGEFSESFRERKRGRNREVF